MKKEKVEQHLLASSTAQHAGELGQQIFFFFFFFSGRHRHCRLGPMGNLPRVARVTTANPIRGPVNRFCELFAGPELVMLFRLSC